MRALFLVLLSTAVMAGTVAAVPPTGVQLNQSRLTINRGTHAVLEAQVTPSDSDTQGLVWSSSSPTTVRVTPESSGKRARVEGLAAGTAVVEVRLPDGTASASCQVTVTVPVERVSVSQESVVLVRGQETDLSAVVHPGDAANKRVRWMSDDEGVVEFVNNEATAFGNNATVRVRGVAAGSTTVTIESEDGRKRAAVQFQIIVPLEALGFQFKELTIEMGETAFVETVLNPLDTTSRGLNYETTDSSVVTVDDEGLISAAGEGTARIIVRSDENELISDYLQVTVQAGAGPGQGISEETPASPGDPEEDQSPGGVLPDSPEEPASPEGQESGSRLGLWMLAGAALLGMILMGVRFLTKKQKPKVITMPIEKPVNRQKEPPRPVSEKDAANLTVKAAPVPVVEAGEWVRVIALSGEFAGQMLELAEDTLVIGRDPLLSHLVYPGSFDVISRKHVVIEHDRETGQCFLRDLSSSGTYVAESGQRLPYDEPVPFRDGQRFYLAVPGELYEIRFDQGPEEEAEE